MRTIFQAVALFLGFIAPLAAGDTPIGHITKAKGNISATNDQQITRTLAKNGPLFEGDTIQVGEDSQAMIKLLDGSMITLVANTQYQISSYQYGRLGEKDSFFSELFQGGIRLLSGRIGKRNPENYQIRTPNGVLGLRGTLVECLLNSGLLYLHVDQGQAAFTNDTGTLVIGTGTVQYAVVARFNAMPQTMMSRPMQMAPFMMIP